MILAKKVRLKPTKEQEFIMFKSAGVSRWAYNWTLSRQQEKYKDDKGFIKDTELMRMITQMKNTDEFSWLKDVSAQIPKRAIKEACESYRKFFKGLSKKPRFKSKKRSSVSFYNRNDKLNISENMVTIERVGRMMFVGDIPKVEKYSNPRITYDGKYWYLSVGIDEEQPHIELKNTVIGIDVGIKDLAVCSNGLVFKNINKSSKVKKLEKRIKRIQRSVSRKYEANKQGNTYIKTKNITKDERRIKLLYRRLLNIRTNHIHQTTNAIVKTKPCMVVMEDLNISGMLKNKHLSKLIWEQKLYEFKRQIEYKCKKYGVDFVQVGRFFPSSKMCSTCGSVKRLLKLSERRYKCDCGLEIDRDMNASINLKKYGESLLSQ
ncbi:RNA-guided endonuclease InsQ/TnpB family protein [Bacillus pseudomycoides]|uniref:RNA-guided endonuclease InsQ/TnpB family protein n=1 Tax=Bacillus pseudomycoides TaxID=64104 RepID=UPI00031ECEB9|nr:RNA-guided endonuclease TnpB family protein [Bacillus pseudomycoides]